MSYLFKLPRSANSPGLVGLGLLGKAGLGPLAARPAALRPLTKPRRWGGLGQSTSDISAMVSDAADQNGVPSALAVAVAQQESGFNQNAQSSAGAIGVMQLMPSTAADLGVDPTDLTQNINGGVQYLGQLLSQYDGDQQQALAAYNWGEGNVNSAIATYGDDWFSSIPSSVQNYVSTILENASTGSSAPSSTSPTTAATSSSLTLSGGNAAIAWLVGAAAVAFVLGDLLLG